MAKNKKATSSSSSYSRKKAAPATNKKITKKPAAKLNSQKAEIISEKINKINKNFESLIAECQNALKRL